MAHLSHYLILLSKWLSVGKGPIRTSHDPTKEAKELKSKRAKGMCSHRDRISSLTHKANHFRSSHENKASENPIAIGAISLKFACLLFILPEIYVRYRRDTRRNKMVNIFCKGATMHSYATVFCWMNGLFRGINCKKWLMRGRSRCVYSVEKRWRFIPRTSIKCGR